MLVVVVVGVVGMVRVAAMGMLVLVVVVVGVVGMVRVAAMSNASIGCVGYCRICLCFCRLLLIMCRLHSFQIYCSH